MTVSRVLNGAVNVSCATRAAVLESARLLDYVPNLHARCLVAGRNLQVAVVYAAGTAQLAPVLLAALLVAARDCVRITPVEIERNAGSARRHAALRSLQEASGVLVLPFDGAERLRRQLERVSMPVIGLGTQGAARHACVRTDEFAAAREMTHLLLSLGHRSVAFIDGDSAPQFTSPRRLGFEAAVRDCNDASGAVQTVEAERSYRGGVQAAGRILACDSSVTALFASHDEIAAGASAAAQRLGRRVPRDLSIVGFGDSHMASRTSPELTTVRIPFASMAACAMEQLIAVIRHGNSGQVVAPLVPYEIVHRRSLAPVAGRRSRLRGRHRNSATAAAQRHAGPAPARSPDRRARLTPEVKTFT